VKALVLVGEATGLASHIHYHQSEGALPFPPMAEPLQEEGYTLKQSPMALSP
jgi:hypothetical protein